MFAPGQADANPPPPAAPPAPPPAPASGAIKAALQAGLRHHQSGQFAEAKAFYHQALAADPRQADALHLLGVIAHQTGDNQTAADLIGKAIAISPAFASYHANLGNVLQALGRSDAAIAAFKAAIRLQPDYAEAHYNLGNAQLALDRFDDALAAYDTALRLRPDYAEALSNRGNALTSLGRLDDAIASFEAAIRLRADYLPAHYKLGNARMAQDDFEAALAAYDAALRLNPDYAEALSNRGIALLSLGRPADALTSFEAALRLTPKLASAHFNLASALHALGRHDAAIAACDAALRFNPDDTAAQSLRQFALYGAHEARGQYEAAFAHLCEGNRLRRPGIPYDEAPALRLMARIEAVFTPALLGRAAPPGGPPDVPIFILGMPRSGSTLVEQILSSHRAVTGGGELLHFRDVVAGLSAAGAPYPETIAARADAEFAAAGAAYRARLQALSPGAARITDKMPANFHHVGLIRLVLPRAKIIHTRRDPVDTCFSCFAQSFTDGQPFTNELNELGRYYRAYARLMAHWRAALPPGAMLEVDYETLVADFEPQLRRILDYCELDWDPACLAFYETERQVLTASATQVRQKLYSHAAGRTQAYGTLLDGLRAILNAPP
jgi:tetratricopeptide (TPR) repeat protein